MCCPLTIEDSNGFTFIGIHAPTDLDGEAIQHIQQTFGSVVQQPARRGIVVDLCDVRYIGTPLVGAMLSLRKAASAMGVPVALGHLRPELSRVFRVRQLHKLFPLFATRAEAVAHLVGAERGDATSAA